ADAQGRLKVMNALFPNTASGRNISDKMRAEAKKHLDEAIALGDPDNLDPVKRERALVLLGLAEDKWPQLPGVVDRRLKLLNVYPILRVGVRELPGTANLSQATAA